jgi:hypothetical protein
LEVGVSRTICMVWLQTLILPISASQVVRIIGVSHWLLATRSLLIPKTHSFCESSLT